MPKRELLRSGPGTGKTTRCIDLFREQILRSPAGIDSRAYFVLPNREHVDRIQSLILKKGIPGLFNAHVLTIQDLAEACLGSAGGRPTDSMRRSIITQALSASDDAGRSLYRFFGESVALEGFQELALQAVGEFKASLLSVPEFKKRAQRLLKDDVFAAKFRDFSVLIERVDARLAELGLSEQDDEILQTDALSGEVRPELVIFDGFYHYTRAQAKFVTLVSGWARRTVVTLTEDRSHRAGEDLFFYPIRTRRFLTSVGFKEVALPQENHRTPDKALRHLFANVFAPSPPRYQGEVPVTVFAAPSERAEYEMVAREIRKLYRQSAVHYSDICLILRAVSGHRAVIESVFAEYNVPVTIHERSRLTESGAAAALSRFLRLAVDGWKRDDLLHLAKSSYFRDRITLSDAVALEREALREGVREGREAWKKLAAAPEALDSVRRFIDWLVGAEKKLLEAKSVNAYGLTVEGFLAPLAGLADAPRADRAALSAIASILKAGRNRYAEGREAFDPSRYASEVLKAVEAGLFSQKARDRNRVQVYDAVMAIPKEYKIVFICDLLEKSFPPLITEDPLFKDAERRSLNGEDPVLDERGWRLCGERYFFYMAMSRTREKLYLTHAAYTAEGKPALASFFIQEMEACFTEGSVRRVQRGLSEYLPEPRDWESESDVKRGIAKLFSEGKEEAFTTSFLESGQAPTGLVRAVQTKDGLSGLRDPLALKKIAGQKRAFSSTSLDSFLVCPFRHFAEHVLRLNRPFEGEAALMGTLLHETLNEYFSALTPESRLAGDYLKDIKGMERAIERIFIHRFEEGPLRNEPLYRRIAWRGSMLTMLKRFVRLEIESSSGLVPSYFEYAFGDKGVDYLRLADESGEILLKGSVDRIDVDPGRTKAVVIDYKRSSRNLAAKLKKGEEIQLPLYSMAVRSLLKLIPIGMEHRVLKTGKREDSGKSPEEIVELLSETERRIRQTVRRIRSGEMGVTPKDCHFCEFDALCRIEEKKGYDL